MTVDVLRLQILFMSNTYRNIKRFAFDEHREAFTILSKTFKEFSLHYFLIGAQALKVHFIMQGLKPSRGTRDIDFAIMVDSRERYNSIMDALKSRCFKETKDPYRLNFKNGTTVIDLLPFGQIEQDYTVNFDERKIEFSVLGLRELNDELKDYYILEDQSISLPIAPLHGIFILKLLSWNDNKYDRIKDLADLAEIIESYWEFVDEEAFSKHHDLFDDKYFQESKAGARILGRHLKKTLNKSMILKTTVIGIIEDQLNPGVPSRFIRKFASSNLETTDYIRILLTEILTGIKE